jgi:hypothetical protein
MCGLAALLATSLLPPVPPAGAAQVDCPDGQVVVIDGTQVCFPQVTGTVPPSGEPIAFGQPRGGGVEVWCIRHHQLQADPLTDPWRVYCNADDWWFHVGWDCYVRAGGDVARDPSWPRWDVAEGEEGRVFEVRCYPPQENQDGLLYLNASGLWQASQFVIGPENPPGYGGTPSVLPGLWVDAVNALAMRGPEIRTAPPVDGASLVNLPVWLWTEVGGRVWPPAGPLHESAAAAGQRVDAYAGPLRIEWDLGDGQPPVSCDGPGLAWVPELSLLEPGECHHIYRRASRDQPAGQFEITAVTSWRVWWEVNGGYDGELEVRVGSTASYRVDEIQVLTTRPR